MELKFDEKGLIPAIVQDHYTKEVLTLAYMNAETLALTIAEGGPCSGAAAARRSGARATPAAMSSMWCPSPPTVTTTRWWWRWSGRPRLPPVPRLLLPRSISLAGTQAVQLAGALCAHQRPQDRPPGGQLHHLPVRKGQGEDPEKVGEECTEVIIAGEKEDRAETIYEISDLAYHVLVLMVQAGITVEDITRELENDMSSTTRSNRKGCSEFLWQITGSPACIATRQCATAEIRCRRWPAPLVRRV